MIDVDPANVLNVVSASVVQIPKSAVLSVKSCSLGYLIPPNPYGRGAQLALSMALYLEQ